MRIKHMSHFSAEAKFSKTLGESKILRAAACSLQVGSFWTAATTQAGGHTGFVILPAK